MEVLDSIGQFITAVGGAAALLGIGGVGGYAAMRRLKGNAALPGAAHDETIQEMREIKNEIVSLHQTFRESNGIAKRERKEILDWIAPRSRAEGMSK